MRMYSQQLKLIQGLITRLELSHVHVPGSDLLLYSIRFRMFFKHLMVVLMVQAAEFSCSFFSVILDSDAEIVNNKLFVLH